MRDAFSFLNRERRGLDRRQDHRPDPSTTAGKVGTCLLIAILLFAGWKWRYIVYTPVWMARAWHADKTPLYSGKTNDIANLTLVQQARNYLSDTSQMDAAGNFTAPEELKPLGIRIEPSWFLRHPPEKVDYNPFMPVAERSFVVTWLYVPGCQKAIGTAPKPQTDWYDIQGQPCYGVCTLSVFMDSNLKLLGIKLLPIKYS